MFRKAAIAVCLTVAALGVAIDARAHSGSVVDGVLTNRFGDPNPDFGQPRAIRNYFVVADDGHVVPVDLSNAAIPDEGISAALNRRVRVTADPNVQADQLAGGGRFPANSLQILDARSVLDVSPVAGSRQYLTLLCKWGGDATEPVTPSYFATEFGGTFPGFNHFFQEVSNGRANINASAVAAAWVTLPQPQSFYFPPGSSTDGTYLEPMGQACVDAAEVQLGGVDFSSYEGINFMFNGAVDSCCAWGGSAQFTLDGAARVVSATWMPYFSTSTFGWRRHSVLAHELSHSFGAPHSDDPEGDEYGNFWDVVSAPAGNFAACPTAVDPNYGCIGQHQVANHKMVMDFVAPARVATHASGAAATTYTLEPAAQAPNAGGTFQYLKVASPVATKYWTVESRKRVGYDTNLPGDGVIVMEVITNRPPNSFGAPPDPVKGNPARLLTPTGSTAAGLGGLSSRWLAGDTYINATADVKITVLSFDNATGNAQVKVEPASTPGEYSFALAGYTVTEGGPAINVAVTRTAPFTTAGSVTWTTSNGTAISGTDFGVSGNAAQRTGTLTWAAGTGGTKLITVGAATSNIPVFNEGVVEGDETFGITLSTPVGGVLGAQTSTTVTVQDNAVFAFNAPTTEVTENGANVNVRVNRTGNTALTHTVSFTTLPGTAAATTDYTAANQTITFAPGETFKDISVGSTMVANPHVHVVNDTAVEAPETFMLRLTTASNGAIVDAAARDNVVTIISDENGVAFAAGTPTFPETAGAQTIQVVRSGGAGAVSVNYAFGGGTAVNGVHYTGVGGTLNWADGETGPKDIPFTIIDDSVVNSARTFMVTLSAASGATIVAPTSKTVTLSDDDNVVQFIAPTISVMEGGILTLTVARTGAISGPADVSFTTVDGTALAGTDFGLLGNTAATTGTLHWAAGVGGNKTFTIPILNDAVIESAKTFQVQLTSPVGTQVGTNSTITVTLNDDEKSARFEFTSYELFEGVNPSAILKVKRVGPATTAASATWATVNGSAISGTDFGVMGSVTPRTGTVSWGIGDVADKTITIPIINNVIGAQPDRTFTVTLTPGTGFLAGAAPPATVTIHDDDIPPQSTVKFAAAKYMVIEGTPSVQLTLNRVDAGGGFGLSGSVKYSTVAGTALATSDYTTATNVVVSWGAGDGADKVINIPIVNNTLPEAPEFFKVVLSAPTPGIALAAPTEAIVWILDDDEAFPLDGAMPAGFSTPGGVAAGWHVSNDPGAFDGAFSLKSDEIDDGQTAAMEMTGTFAAGNVTFKAKVSSEAGFDELRFYIDGVLQTRWSGVMPTGWQTTPTYVLGAGVHTLRWEYVKDASVTVGQDAAWIDALVTPAFTP